MTFPATIVWFRQDLRIRDNPTLTAAIQRGGPVIPVFIWAPEEEGAWSPGGASQWWLAQSLCALDTDLRAIASRLIIRRGPTERSLLDLVHETGAKAILWSDRYEPAASNRDIAVRKALVEHGCQIETFNSTLLHDPEAVRTSTGLAFRVFTPFWEATRRLPVDPPKEAVQPSVTSPRSWPWSLTVKELDLAMHGRVPPSPSSEWRPGERGAADRLSKFVRENLADYERGRDKPSAEATSLLSPHLHFGEISSRQIWHALQEHGWDEATDCLREAASSFLRQLAWREFAGHLLINFPHTPDEPFRPLFSYMPWRKDDASFEAWKTGQTGYPMIDAGMRQLHDTGEMPNRVRMLAASFLTKTLLVQWQQGACWFWDRLLDADLANNTLGWQWTAGCGADAAPYFRIFNPVLQGQRFDPEGSYVRRWLPEIARLPKPWIHCPWAAPAGVLAHDGVTLGTTYPRPIVDLQFARDRALRANESLRHLRKTLT